MNDLEISVTALRDMLERNEPVTVLDIRPADQRSEWAIPGSLHLDVYDALWAGDEHALDGVPLPPDQPVVAVCAAGNTSLIAAEQLRRRGIESVSLRGGMRAWSLAWNVAPVTQGSARTAVWQIRRTGKGCLSYLVAADGEAAVIDPSVEVGVYLGLARSAGARITKVLETHVHADHLSRARELARQTGALLLMPEQERVQFPFESVKDGDEVAVGTSRFRALHTPGHTFESTCYLLEERVLFTGDTLFTSSVGRPDLKAQDSEAARKRAHALYASLQRLLALPDDTLVLSCHTSEPIAFDGKAIVMPLGEVRRAIPLLAQPEEAFVSTLLQRIPPTPPNHLHIVAFNEKGEMPPGDPTRLEAGANRCAVA